MDGTVAAVCSSPVHDMAKPARPEIHLVAGHGVEGDVHAGATVKHRSRLHGGAARPNLRQVHLIHAELHDELRAAGFAVEPGEMGENITTRGVDLLALPAGARLHLGAEAVVEVTGLRNPCTQLDGIQTGLMDAVLDRDEQGDLVRKTGVMSVVVTSGAVRAGDAIRIELPATPYERLQPV